MPVVPDSFCAAPIPVSTSLTLKFFAVDINGIQEDVKTEIYEVTGGELWTWGYNLYGQLGIGTTTDSSVPVHVTGLTGAVASAGGFYHSIALKNDGTVWTWGRNRYGQLGDATQSTRLTPVQVMGITDVVVVAAGEEHSIALKKDGTVWTWGYNYYGQLGSGTTYNRYVPGQVNGLTNVVAVAAGRNHSIALKNDGTIWAWGYNYDGELGDGTTIHRYAPVQVIGMTNVVAISGGGLHSVALKNDGTVWAWGQNNAGQLGIGTIPVYGDYRSTPVQVIGLFDVAAIGAGGGHTGTVKNDGTVWTWGMNNAGQLGDGTTETRTLPIQVNGLANIVKVEGAYYSTFSLRSDGTLWGWGGTPSQVQLASPVVDVAHSHYHYMAIRKSIFIETPSLPNGIVNDTYNQMLTASGGLAPYSWSIFSGALPEGVSLVSATGELSGSLTSPGTFNFTVQVTDVNGAKDRKVFPIIVYDTLIITTASLPDGQFNKAYSQGLAATGGLSPYNWSVVAGNLPPGPSLSASTGIISGTPAAKGTFSFTVQVLDDNATAATQYLSLYIK